ncbi:MAG: 2-oxoglutarate dehydrogenase complex dihydrolipoyllysine-residue succinyltransferase [Deltaproteobacteria bacterium]|nr:2-oxoglutarate dehydrogenase complex dihydrolipoyllysine-residue succinyltransferase [Deltaproteobacteria bacterium]
MAVEVRIPTLGESVTEGVIVRWVKRDGDIVAKDDILLELETDKASMEIPAEAAGTLRIVRQESETVRVGDVVARIDEAGGGASRSAPAPVPAALLAVPGSGSVASPSLAAASAREMVGGLSGRGVGPLSPAVRRLIEEHAVDPAVIPASGKGGRLLKEDVLAYLERASAAAPADVAPRADDAASATAAAPAMSAPAPMSAAAAMSAPAAMSAASEGEEPVPMTRLRKRIAERLVQAQHTAAILTTFNEIDMSAVMALRATQKERFQKAYGVPLGFMSFFARACIAALREIREINAEIRGDAVVYKRFVHLGIAVGTERGLVVPIVHHAERMSFADLEREIARLAQLARDNKLAIDDLAGGTFTISNGGVYDSLLSTPILNPPQSGILGMHKIEKRPVAVDDQVVVRPMMYVALSYDHRLVDGAQAVTFLVHVKERLEDPARLLLDV